MPPLSNVFDVESDVAAARDAPSEDEEEEQETAYDRTFIDDTGAPDPNGPREFQDHTEELKDSTEPFYYCCSNGGAGRPTTPAELASRREKSEGKV